MDTKIKDLSKEMLFTSSQVLKAVNITYRQLAYWELKGIIKPTYQRLGTRDFKRYRQQDIDTLKTVKKLLDEGYSLPATDTLKEIAKRKEAEEKLRQSEEFNKRIIESSNDCIKILDLEGRLLFMSRGGQQLMEINDITPYLNKSWVDFWQGEDRKAVLEAISAAKNGGIGTFQGYNPTVKDTPKWWDIIITPILGSDNKVERLLSVSRDITERKKAEERVKKSAEEWRRTFDAITDFVSIHDKDYNLVKVNKALADSLGKNPKELIGKKCFKVLHGTNEPWSNCPHTKAIESKQPITAEIDDPNLGKKLLVSISPIFDDKGELIGSVHVAKNITEKAN